MFNLFLEWQLRRQKLTPISLVIRARAFVEAPDKADKSFGTIKTRFLSCGSCSYFRCILAFPLLLELSFNVKFIMGLLMI